MASSRYGNSSSSPYTPLLKSLIRSRNVSEGRHLHDHLIRVGSEGDAILMNHLVEFYGKCGLSDEAFHGFSRIPAKNVFSWTIMITSCVQHNHGHLGLKLLRQMEVEGVMADDFTYSSILGAFTTQESLDQGKFVHACIVSEGFGHGAIILTALCSMYGKCGSIELARDAFDAMPCHDSASWNSMIAAYAHHGHEKEALQLYYQMWKDGVRPTDMTFTAILRACSSPDALEHGRDIHAHITDGGFGSDIVKTALVSMYGNCGSLEEAQQAFQEIYRHDIVSVNAMLGAYIQNDRGRDALQLFGQIWERRLEPTCITYATALSACSLLGAIAKGKAIHMMIIEEGFESMNVVATAVVSMYGKCGGLADAWTVFNRIIVGRDCIAWNAIIAAYAQNGDDQMALHLFKQMEKDAVKPDGVTYLNVLLVCSYTGSLEDAHGYFDSMVRDHAIEPNPRHYACMIDLCGRAGLIDEAENFLKKMPFEPDAVVLTAFSGACRLQGDIARGKWAAERLIKLDPHADYPYIMLSHFYAAEGRWLDVADVRKKMEQNVKNKAGRSWIEVDDKFHEFVSGDGSHPRTREIYSLLNRLNDEMKRLRYSPEDTIDEGSKEHILYYDSEMLAIAFGLLTVPPGKQIRVFKNLQVSPDCHAATKSISRIVGRDIIVRDSNLFHHFTNGICSCGNYS